MDREIFGGNRVGADDDFQLVAFFHEMNKMVDAGAGRVSYKKPRGEVDDADAIFYHLLSSIFDVPAGAASTSRETGDLHIQTPVDRECAFPVPERPEAFSSRAAPVSITDYNTDPLVCFHFFTSKRRVFL